MKNLDISRVAVKRSLLYTFFVAALFLFIPEAAAQRLKINSISEWVSSIKEASDATSETAIYIIGAILMIGLGVVVFMAVNNHPNTKTAILWYVVGVTLTLLGTALISV